MMNWLLALNVGSSSVKFALFEAADRELDLQARGQVERLDGLPRLILRSKDEEILEDYRLPDGAQHDHRVAFMHIIRVLTAHFGSLDIAAVGHRVVHGGPKYSAPIIVTDDNFSELAALSKLAPLHQPYNLSGISAARKAFPGAVQVACFDTAFHRSQPWVSKTFALPRGYYDEGVRRYGFHGLSYEYVTALMRQAAPQKAERRVIVAHLGNGASMCAIHDHQSVGTTMGFSALNGLPMGTRCGQLDPGVILYLLQEKAFTPDQIAELLYKESGLKGLSGLSGDLRVLEAAGTPQAQQAIEYFVFRIRCELGALTATLGGLDVLVFCGGIGENSWQVRKQVCANLEWIGIELDDARNRAGEFAISSQSSDVRVLVVRTDEELMVAKHALAILHAAK